MNLDNFVTREEFEEALLDIALLKKEICKLRKEKNYIRKEQIPIAFVSASGQLDLECSTEQAISNCLSAKPVSSDPLKDQVKPVFSKNKPVISAGLRG
jgi:hypothetical protein